MFTRFLREVQVIDVGAGFLGDLAGQRAGGGEIRAARRAEHAGGQRQECRVDCPDIARALVGKSKGDVVDVVAPNGTKSYEIVEVRYV